MKIIIAALLVITATAVNANAATPGGFGQEQPEVFNETYQQQTPAVLPTLSTPPTLIAYPQPALPDPVITNTNSNSVIANSLDRKKTIDVLNYTLNSKIEPNQPSYNDLNTKSGLGNHPELINLAGIEDETHLSLQQDYSN